MSNQIQIFSNVDAFEKGTLMAKALATSTLLPTVFQGEKNIGNILIALEYAQRVNMPVLMIMQNLHVIHGKPTPSGTLVISLINRKFNKILKYAFDGSAEDKRCYAYIEQDNNEKIVGPIVSMRMAHAEGWLTKSGSKWKTMPDLMMRYRAACFFARTNCPEVLCGLHTREEAIDMGEQNRKPERDYIDHDAILNEKQHEYSESEESIEPEDDEVPVPEDISTTGNPF